MCTVLFAFIANFPKRKMLFEVAFYRGTCIRFFILPISMSIYSIQAGRGGSRTAAASKMEHFVIIVNGWKPLTIITIRSILDVAAVLDPPLAGSCEYKYEFQLLFYLL